MAYFVLILKKIGLRACIQIIIFSQPVTFHSIESGDSEFSTPPAHVVQNGVSHAAKRVHSWLFCSLAPFVNACWFLAGLLLRHPFPACGIFLLQKQTFSLPLNLVCEVYPGPVLKLSSVLLVEALPFGVPSHPPNLMSSVN